MPKKTEQTTDAPATVWIRNDSSGALHIAHLRAVVDAGAVIEVTAADAPGLIGQDIWTALTEEQVAAHVASLNSDADAQADAQNQEQS